MFRLMALVVVVVLALLAIRMAVDLGRSAAARSNARWRAARPSGSHAWERRTDQVRRQLRGASGPDEPREDLVAFVESHPGVEAYVEPKTMMSPMSVVLIDADGKWRRFPLRDDRFLRALAKERGVPVFDASRVGYPPRMRRGRRGDDDPTA